MSDDSASPAQLPSGTVTFLFTDIEGSTARWEEQPANMQAAVARHDALLNAAFKAHNGYVFKTIGDAFCVTFARVADALAAAVEVQRALHNEQWPITGGLKVRMALHTGVAEERDRDYFGPTVNRVARILATGHGGQILLSHSSEQLLNGVIPNGTHLEDLGEHSLKDLQRPEQLFMLVVEDLPANHTPLKSLNYKPHNLPPQPTPFIGREKEVNHIKQQLLRPGIRCLTLTGPGGAGKTRLALQAGAEVIDEFADGVFFFTLSETYDPTSVASEMERTLGIKEVEGQSLTDSLKDYLKSKQILLILDNFEQIANSSSMLTDFLRYCPKLKFMITSRVALRLYGEQEYTVPPMTLPDPRRHITLEELAKNEAVQLFMDRAKAVKSDFELTEENASAVVQICRKLDGLPLALELAAVRIRLLPPKSMLARLESRLKLLTGGAKNLPARQQTLRAAIDWSYDLLNEQDRMLFRRMAIFVGGATFEAMEAVCNVDGEIDVLEQTESLVSKSLLRQQTQADGEPRFVMLETVREYAMEHLMESEDTERLHSIHAEHYLALAEMVESKLTGSSQSTWLDVLEVEHDNLQTALRWFVEKCLVEQALRMAGALSRFWLVRSYLTEGRRQLAEVFAFTETQDEARNYIPGVVDLSAVGEEVRGYIQQSMHDLSHVLSLSGSGTSTPSWLLARAKALNGAGNLSQRQGDYDEAKRHYLESLAIRQELGDQSGIAAAYNNLASIAYRQGDYDRARALYQESLAIKRQVGDKRSIAATLNNLGILSYQTGNYGEARRLYEESLVIRRQLGDRQGASVSLEGLGNIAFEEGDYRMACAYLEECLAIRTDLNDRQGIAHVLQDLGELAFAEGDLDQARVRWQESLRTKQELDDKQGIAAALEGFARLESARQRYDWALRLASVAMTLRRSIESQLSETEQSRLNKWLDVARAALGSSVQPVWEAGRMMPLEEAISYALSRQN
jgi:predicted ATPase/class 3 adenylate cyclase